MNQISSEEGSSSSTSLRGIAFLACLATAGLLGSLLIIQTLHFLKDGHMDFYVFYTAAMRLRTDVDIFLPVEMSENYYLWYIYPPFLAVLFLPLTYLSLETAAATFNIINGLLILACLWLGGREVLRRTKGRLDVATLPVVICLATVFLFPRIKAELDQGQTDMIVLLGMLLSLFWIKRHPWLAGIALGLVANIKYQTVIFVPYFIVRQWWPAVGGFSFGAVIAGLSGALIVGWERNLDYLKRAFAGMGQMIGVDVKSDVLPDIYAVDWLGSISAMSTSARWSESLGGGTGVFILLVGLVALACFLIGWWCYKANGQRLFVGRNGIKGRQDSRQETLVMLEWLGADHGSAGLRPPDEDETHDHCSADCASCNSLSGRTDSRCGQMASAACPCTCVFLPTLALRWVWFWWDGGENLALQWGPNLVLPVAVFHCALGGTSHPDSSGARVHSSSRRRMNRLLSRSQVVQLPGF